jgi:asparagine synthase (glutamine-hydrolysing)
LDGTSSVPSWINSGPLIEVGVQLVKPHPRPEFDLKGRRVVGALSQSLFSRGLTHLLRHGDRNSMHFGIESRVPFLTLDMVNLLLSMPEEYLISPQGETKHVFRAAMRGIVPDDVLDRKDKIGFATPEKDWLLSMADIVRRWMKEDIDLPFFNRKVALQEFEEVIQGTKPFDWKIWRMINFIRWYRINNE